MLLPFSTTLLLASQLLSVLVERTRSRVKPTQFLPRALQFTWSFGVFWFSSSRSRRCTAPSELLADAVCCLGFDSLLGSLRTNVVFVILFTVLDVAFFLLAAGYFRIGEGRDPTSLLKAGGAFGFVTTCCGWWIMLALTLGSTGMPFNVPLGDLSGFLSRKS